MKRRVHALFLAVLMLVSTVLGVWTPVEVKADDGTTVIIHYQRPDGDYTDWDVWAWDKEGTGAVDGAQTFDYEDEFGKICVIQSEATFAELGFIIRNGGDAWIKDYNGDQFITIEDGFEEVWIKSGQEGYETTSPDGTPSFDLSQIGNNGGENDGGNEGGNTEVTPPAEGQVQVNLHYYRYGADYSGWNVWFWPDGADGAAVEFATEDDFGKVATYNVDASAGRLGFIVRLNEWEAKDTDADRYIDLSKAVNGVLDAYVIEGDSTIYFDSSDADLSPKFLSAVLDTAQTFKVKVTVPVDTDATASLDLFKVVDQNGKEYKILNLFSEAGTAAEFEINMAEQLPLTNTYSIVSDTYGTYGATFGNILNTEEFEEAYYYDGDDLGARYSKESTTFKVWSPFAGQVHVYLYNNGAVGNAYEKVAMTKGDKGVWSATVEGDLNGVFYTYAFTNNGETKEAVDLYARATGVNGQRGMVVDLSATNPDNWSEDKPKFVSPTDAIIYEMHVRDFTIDESSGVENKGKYLGLTETGTVNKAGLSTGLDYIKKLGITHVQLLPVYDYSPNSVDETNLDEPQFNWGYDPYNYNVPEGSYSTNPFDGATRINEFKQMVQSFHDNDIRVVMDVVYNHTAESANSWMNITVPRYYYRMNADGSFGNGSACGNEVASERAMVRKYIVDSVVYWATEYNIDGFRFDLMGLIDLETMEAVREALDEIDPTIMIYGEGWMGDQNQAIINQNIASLKKHITRFGDLQIGAFSDDMRDGIKGSVFGDTDTGFVTGKLGQEERIKASVIAATSYTGIQWQNTNTDIKSPWANNPTQVINYVSAHDNHTLWDKICLSREDATEADRIRMNLLSASIVYTSQGIPFMLSGEEILRSKEFDHNSYKSSDAINSIKWDDMNTEVLDYYKGLIQFRKTHAGLRMTTGEDVEDYLTFLENLPTQVVAYTIDGKANGEISDELLIIYNADEEAVEIEIPEGEWKVCIEGTKAGTEVLRTVSGGKVTVEPISCLALVKGETELSTDIVMEPWIIAIIVVATIVVVIVVIFAVTSSKKKAPKNAEAEAVATETAETTEVQAEENKTEE